MKRPRLVRQEDMTGQSKSASSDLGSELPQVRNGNKRKKTITSRSQNLSEELQIAPKLLDVGEKGSDENPLKLHLTSLPAGSSTKGLRSFFAAAKATHVEMSGSNEAFVTFATVGDAELGRQRWDRCQIALGNSELAANSRRGTKRAQAQLLAQNKSKELPRKDSKMSLTSSSNGTAATQAHWNDERHEMPVVEKSEATTRLRLQSLTHQIANLAARRQLGGAKAVFDQLLQEGLAPNVQTFAALINAYVNSGDVDGACKVFSDMERAGCAANVVVYTALLKGHCRVGDIARARSVLESMNQQSPPIVPDLRAINTILRGCARVGDVAAAEDLFKKLQSHWHLQPDDAACKFMVRLLCHALRFDDAHAIVAGQQVERPSKPEMIAASGNDEQARGDAELCLFWAKGRCKKGTKCRFYHDPAIVQNKAIRAEREASHMKVEHLGAIATMYVDLAHSAALLNRFTDCESSLAAASDTLARMGKMTIEDDTAAVQAMSRRTLELDIARIQAFVQQKLELNPMFFFGRTFVFSTSDRCKRVTASWLTALRQSFGFDACVQRGLGSSEDLKHRFRRCVLKSGRLRWQQVFGRSRADLPLKLEVGAGSGEWAIAQAKAESSSANWVAMELMHDRVYSMFSQLAFSAMPNLCILGGDASRILPRRIEVGSVHHVFANFPEPPHVSGSEAAESSLHLWSASFFRHVHEVLRINGRLTILTDNKRYGQNLARTVAELRSHDCSSKLFSSITVDASSSSTLDVSGKKKSSKLRRARSTLPAEVVGHEDIDGICLHHGTPGSESGHVVKVTSQFDSLWESSKRTERYFLSLLKL